MPSSQATFETWLQSTGKPVTSRYNGYRANYATWRDYSLLVYGTPGQVSGNRYDTATRQYASLGFSYDELVVTNSLFPDDSPGGVTKSTPWQWTELNLGESARLSWARLDARQKTFIKSSSLTYRGNSYGGMTFQNLGLSESTTVVLAPPSWHMGFALYTNHYLPGNKYSIRYATFNGNGAGDVKAGCRIDLKSQPDSDGKFIMPADKDFVDISYSIIGNITGFSGLATAADIRNGGVCDDKYWSTGTGTGPWRINAALRVKREDMAGKTEKSFMINGEAWVVSNYGDIRLVNTQKSVTVRLAPDLPAFGAKISIKGGIGYFAGQSNALGRYLPNDPHRFLGLERMKITFDFNRDPAAASWTFNGKTFEIGCRSGVSHYEASMTMPLLPSTMSWSGIRLRPPMSLSLRASDRSQPSQTVTAAISDIEITGSVYDITFAQAY